MIFFLFLMSYSHSWALQKGIYNSFYNNGAFTVEEKILGRSCYSLNSSSLGYNCNPAFLADDDKNNLRLNILTDPAVKDVMDYRANLRNHDYLGLIQKLDNNTKKLLVSSASSNIWYQYDWWSLSYTPLRTHVFNYVRNPALTEITSHISLEREVMFRTAGVFTEHPNFRIGSNLRYVSADFVRQQFRIIDVIANPQIIEILHQETLYFEPGMAYSFHGKSSPTLSATLTDLALFKKGDSKDTNLAVELGFMTHFYPFDNHFRSSLHFTSRSDLNNFSERLRWSGIYDFSSDYSFNFTLNATEYGIGFLGRWNSLTFGIGHLSQKLNFKGQSLAWNSSLIGELGLSF